VSAKAQSKGALVSVAAVPVRLAIAIITLLVAVVGSAGTMSDRPVMRKYVSRKLPKCPQYLMQIHRDNERS